MVKIITAKFLMPLFLLVTLAVSSQVFAQEIEVSVDRAELIRGETFVLTIRVYGQQGGVQMDMAPLRENFDIILTRTSSQMRSVNNRTESWTDYMITLFPRDTGELVVPAMEVAGVATQPLTVNVLPQSQTAITPGQTLFMETIINKESVYVQEQLLFTIRLYYTINGIRNPQFTELEMDNAVIQMIGSANQYEQLIDGERYGVYEKQYVIFPQRSGTLEIPDIIFRGEVTDGSSAFVFRNMNTRTITAFSEGSSIEVKERPATFPSNTWLPADNIVIEETWSSDPTALRVGDSITRTVSITAYGLDGAALPPLQSTQIDKLNLYPEPPVISRTFIDGNIVGKRVETTAMLSIERGSVVIPEISLPWWDISSEELKFATVPSSLLVVSPSLAEIAAAEQLAEANAAQPERDDERTTLLPGNMLADDLIAPASTPSWILTLATLLAAGIVAIWYLLQRKPAAKKTADKAGVEIARSLAYADEIAINNENMAYKRLEKTCASKDPVQIRLALIAWARQFYQDADVITLNDLIRRSKSSTLQESCEKIQASMYGQSANTAHDEPTTSLAGHIEQLLKEINQLRKQGLQKQTQQRKIDNYALPPLYKV